MFFSIRGISSNFAATPHPTLSSAVIESTQPNVVILTFSDPIVSSDWTTGMSVSQDASALAITLGREGNSADEVHLYLTESVKTGETMLISYDDGVGDYADSGSATLESFTDTAVTNNAVTYDWMETQLDGYTTPAGTLPSLTGIKAPRTMVAEGRQPSQANRSYKYDFQAAAPLSFSNILAIQTAAAAEAPAIAVRYLRMAIPVHTSEYEYGNGGQQGWCMPNADTGVSTTYPRVVAGNVTGFEGDPSNSTFFAGHWLYRADQLVTTTPMNTNVNTVIGVTGSTANFTIGTGNGARYVCIRDGQDDWTNASHHKIIGKTSSSITLAPAFNCTFHTHSTNSYISQHVVYNGRDIHWGYNMSTQCPDDAGGHKLWWHVAEFLRLHMQYGINGDYFAVDIDGLMFDVDRSDEFIDDRIDCNNDSTIDRGRSPTGDAWWGDGIAAFYAKLRTDDDSIFIVGGDRWAIDGVTLQGTQEEGFFTGGKLQSPDYTDISVWFYSYVLRCHIQPGPPMEHSLVKQGSFIFPTDGNSNPNSIIRLSLAGILMDEGWFHQQFQTAWGTYNDTWYDEYGVDVVPGSGTYGTAVANDGTNGAEIRTHNSWLGDPVSNYYNIYSTEFADAEDMVTNGQFETNTTGWSAFGGTSISRDAGTGMTGSASLKITDSSSYAFGRASYGVTGEVMSGLTVGNEYTICYSAKAENIRHIRVNFGGMDGVQLIDTTWRRYTATFTAGAANPTIKFETGRETGDIWLDDIRFFEGIADIKRRDYEFGMVLMNGSKDEAIVDLEANDYWRIAGTQDEDVNNGQKITWGSITVPARDGLILVRGDQS